MWLTTIVLIGGEYDETIRCFTSHTAGAATGRDRTDQSVNSDGAGGINGSDRKGKKGMNLKPRKKGGCL